jgi:hypothetical protein
MSYAIKEPTKTPQNLKDLLTLADFLDKIYEYEQKKHIRKFDILVYAKVIDPTKRISRCNTVACAAGWAGMIPEFRRRGLKTNPSENYITLEGSEKIYALAVEKFLGLTCNEALSLFYPDSYTEEDFPDSYTEEDFPDVTAQMAANKIRKLVEKYNPDGTFKESK